MRILYVNKENAKMFNDENKKHPVFAKYFSPTCPACISMESEWDNMCKDIDAKYNTDMIMAQIDPKGMTELEGMDTFSDVAYVPTIVILKSGKKVMEYDGPKQKDKMIKFLLENDLIKPKMKGGYKSKARKSKARKSKARKNKARKSKARKNKARKSKSRKY